MDIDVMAKVAEMAKEKKIPTNHMVEIILRKAVGDRK